MEKKIYKENSNPSQNYTIISFFTKNYELKAKRLIDSLDKFNLTYKVFEIPEIHYSKSIKGTFNLDYCQPKLILDFLDEYKTPILFVDIDIVFKESPKKIPEFKKKDVDFAIYNWFEDIDNDAYKPIIIKTANKDKDQPQPKKFYIFSHSMDYLNQDECQLYSSGAVGYFSNSGSTRNLLSKWFENIKTYPNSTDDHTLDYTFNFTLSDKKNLNIEWLDKSYCRYNFWIFTAPIIDHPDDVTIGKEHTFESVSNKIRFDIAKLKTRYENRFSKNCFLDIKNKSLYKAAGQELFFIKKFCDDLFIEDN